MRCARRGVDTWKTPKHTAAYGLERVVLDVAGGGAGGEECVHDIPHHFIRAGDKYIAVLPGTVGTDY